MIFRFLPVQDGLNHPLHVLEGCGIRTFLLDRDRTLILIAAGCLYKIRLLSDGGSAVAELLGGGG